MYCRKGIRREPENNGGLHVDADLCEGLFRLECRAERGNDDDVVRGEFGQRNKLLTRRRAQEADASLLKVVVHVRIVDHLRKEENPTVRMLA